jgi:hypothetical protein
MFCLEKKYICSYTYVGVVSARFLNNSRSFNKAGSIFLLWLNKQ